MFCKSVKYIPTTTKVLQNQGCLSSLIHTKCLNVIQYRKMTTNQERYDNEDKFIRDIFKLGMEKAVTVGRHRTNPILQLKTPKELESYIDFDLSEKGEKHTELVNLCSKILENSMLMGHPRIFHQQTVGVDSYGLAGNIITDFLNVNSHTFEIAPCVTMAEVTIFEHILKLFGFSDGEAYFCPGGSYSNMIAMNVAKTMKFPNTKENGILSMPKLISFCSEQAHPSAIKNATLMGFGADNCVKVKCDGKGKMLTSDLEEKILIAKNEGSIPFFITATAGTAALGAFDPFNEIADLCEKHNIWMHVDAAWGGSAKLSKKYRHLLDGSERANSVTWNPQKMISVPTQCSLLLLKKKSLMECHEINVPYLFQNDKPYDVEYDLGRKSVSCGRRGDGLKLWLMWKAKGDEGLEKHVDKAFDNKEYLIQEIKKKPNFRMVIDEPECANVQFWYIAPSLIGKQEDEKFFEKLGEISKVLKGRMQKRGSLYVKVTEVRGLPSFLKLNLINPDVNHSDMDFVLDEVERNGKDL